MTGSAPLATAGLALRRQWMDIGSTLFLDTIDALADGDLDASTALPGWSRRHVVAHVATNAEALTRLAVWAHTGVEHLMYASPEQRTADIDAGARLAAGRLRAWLTESTATLGTAFDTLSPQDWRQEVLTAQGRCVAARELPWMRCRELVVHAVDLDSAVTFADLPRALLRALNDDVVARRSATAAVAFEARLTDDVGGWHVAGPREPLHVSGSLAAMTAWFTGRPADGVITADGAAASPLPPWL